MVTDKKKSNRQGTPIIITSPAGELIPMSSFEMAASFFSELFEELTGDAKPYIDYKYISGRAAIGETSFESGPLKGWSFQRYETFQDQRQAVFRWLAVEKKRIRER